MATRTDFVSRGNGRHCLSKQRICIYKCNLLGAAAPKTLRKDGGDLRKRNNGILLWLSDDELSLLQKKCKKAGLTRQAFYRKLLSESKITETPPADFYTLNREMNRIGSNIEQILRVMNTKSFIDGPKLRTALNELIELEEEMWRVFKPGNL